MFGIGASELVVIVIVALIVVGPKKLPDALRAVGKALGQFRRATSDLRREVGYDEVVSEVTKPLRDGMASVQEEMRRVEGDVRDGFSPKRLFDDDDAYSANKKPAALPAKGETVDPYPPPSSSGYLTFDTEYPAGGADDYAALPENANVYPEASSATASEGAKPVSEEKPAGAPSAKGEGTGTA